MYILRQTGEENCIYCKSILKALTCTFMKAHRKDRFLIVSRTYLNHNDYKLIRTKDDDNDDVGEH